jgi:hypothetical protein
MLYNRADGMGQQAVSRHRDWVVGRRINYKTKDQIDIGRTGAAKRFEYVVVVRKPWLHCPTADLQWDFMFPRSRTD